MALTVTVTPGIVLNTGEVVTTAKLNSLGHPTVAISGETEAGDIAGIETPSVAHLANAPFFRYKTADIRATGQTPIGEPVTLNPIDVRAFGAIGDGLNHPVSEWISDGTYADLAAVQVAFPWVASASDEIDYAAIQGACDYAWGRILASRGATDPSPSGSATVIIPAGTYLINRTVIVPPKCTIRGHGMGITAIQFAPVADYTWSFINSTLITTAAYAAFYVRARVAITRSHITDGFSRTAKSTDDSTGAGTTEWSDGGGFSDLTIGLKTINSAGILATSLKHCAFERLQIRDSAASPATTGKYGIAISLDAAAGLADGCLFTGNRFEGLKTGLLIDQAIQCRIASNHMTGITYGVHIPRLSMSAIALNVITNRISGVKGTTGIEFLGAGVTVAMNVVDCFDRAIFAAGGALAIHGNACITHWDTTAADGYAITVMNASQKGGTLSYAMNDMDSGISLTGNTVNGSSAALPAVATYKPFLITSNGAALEVNAAANGAASARAGTLTQYRVVGAATAVRILDTPAIIAAGIPAVMPDFVGQQYIDSTAKKTYCAVEMPAIVATGNIVTGVTYWVCGPGTVTYNSVSVAAGATFLGVTGQTGFTAAGGATVYAPPWRSNTLDLSAPTFQVTTLDTVTANTRVLLVSELAAFVKVPFNANESHATITLPDPATASGIQFTLIATKAATTGAYGVLLNCAVDNKIIDNDNTQGFQYPTGIPVSGTTTLAGGYANASTSMVALKCDGSLWYMTR